MENAVWKSNDGNQTENDSVLLCFSHLRWDFVYQRPQHIMTLASNTKKVVYFEEPVFEDVQHAFMRINEVGPSVKVVTPVLKVGTGPADIDAAQRRLLDLLVASTPQNLLTTWYYTPMALRFSDHIRCDVCVYDTVIRTVPGKNSR